MNYNNKKSNYQGNFYSKKNHYNNKKYNSNFNNYYENNFTNNYDYSGSGYKRIKIYNNNNNNNNNYNANNSYQNIQTINAYNPNFIYKVELLNNSYLYNNTINATTTNIKKINDNNNNYNNYNNMNKKEEIFKIKIKLKNEEKELILYKGEDINNSINKFCSQNKIDNKLIKPIFNKVKYYLEFYENLINKTYLEKEDFDILNKVNLLYNDNKGI